MTVGSISGRHLPPQFRLGVATAAYQIEGATDRDGRGQTIWDTYTHTPGRIQDGTNGDVAIDHYNRLSSDLDILQDLGVDDYRFSIAWSRIQPTGRGPVNEAGLDFYGRLVDGLLERNIRPVATLYHWDLPQSLEDDGGWTTRDTADRFAEYAGIVTKYLGDRVANWMTLNEPWCSAFLGYGSGVMAPGRTDPLSALRAVHHLNLAHGLAVQSARANLATESGIGVALNVHVPRGIGERGEEACRQIDEMANQAFIGPILRGAYPRGFVERTSEITDWSFVRDGDLEQIAQPIDFLGVNYYSTVAVRMWDGVSPRSRADGHKKGASPWVSAEDVEFLDQDPPHTAMGWNIAPDGLVQVLKAIGAEFSGLPLYVSENGAAFDDRVEPDGKVRDDQRIEYIGSHLAAVQDCLDAGVDVRGYYLWTWIDNFEWGHGYGPKFGIMRVEDESLDRHPKESYTFYRSVCRDRRLPPGPLSPRRQEVGA